MSFTRSRALSSDGRRICNEFPKELGVTGDAPALEGVEAAEDVEVEGDGGPRPRVLAFRPT